MILGSEDEMFPKKQIHALLYGTVGVISGRSTLRFAFSQCFGCS